MATYGNNTYGSGLCFWHTFVKIFGVYAQVA